MARSKSRPAQWADAIADARSALDDIESAQQRVADAFGTLADLQAEYQDWLDNLPDSLSSSPTADLLNEVTALDLEPDVESSTVSDLASALDDAEAVQLPRGFGND